MTNTTRLTIGITCCYRSMFSRISQMLFSLFNPDMTTEVFECFDSCHKLKRTYATEQFNELNAPTITINEPIQIIIVLDGKNELLEQLISGMINRYLRRYQQYVRFKFHINNIVMSVGFSRNFIISNAIGEYVKLCDDDDLSVNINELLRIIDKSNGADYIECCMSNLTKPVDKPLYTGWFPTNVIIKSEFLRTYNLMFVPSIVGEDSIWRCDIYQTMRRIPSTKIKVFAMSIYMIYWKSNKTISETDENNYASMMQRIFEHEKRLFGIIPLNTYMLYIIGNMSYTKKHFVDMSSYIIEHADDFEYADYIKQINTIRTITITAPLSQNIDITHIRNTYWNNNIKTNVDFRKLAANINNPKLIELANEFTAHYATNYNKKMFAHMYKCTTLMTHTNRVYHNIVERINDSSEYDNDTFDELNTPNISNLLNVNYGVPLALVTWIYLNPLTSTSSTTSTPSTPNTLYQQFHHTHTTWHVVTIIVGIILIAHMILEWLRLYI